MLSSLHFINDDDDDFESKFDGDVTVMMRLTGPHQTYDEDDDGGDDDIGDDDG